MLDAVVLALLLLQSVLGLFSLLRWLGARRPGGSFPTGLVSTHLVLALATTGLWITRMATDELVWGWIALVVVLLANGLGDLLLAGRWRLDQAMSGRWLRGYLAAVRGLRNPKRRAGAAHLVLAGISTVTLAIACLVAI